LRIQLTILISLTFLAFSCQAAKEQEIQHLIKFIQTTDCQYERNGEFYNGLQAVKHINRKYAHYGDEITSAEDFIFYAASKSSFSGQAYRVHCQDKKPQKSQDWLSTELGIYRQR